MKYNLFTDNVGHYDDNETYALYKLTTNLFGSESIMAIKASKRYSHVIEKFLGVKVEDVIGADGIKCQRFYYRGKKYVLYHSKYIAKNSNGDIDIFDPHRFATMFTEID